MSAALRFDGRVAIITGARQGIGKAHAKLLAERGCALVVNSRGGLETVVGLAEAAGAKVIAVEGDVGDPATADRLVAAALDNFGRVDIVINNAGERPTAPVDSPIEIFDHCLQVNVNGHYYVTRAAWPVMKAQGYGRVLMTSSTAGMYALAEKTAYCTSKAALYGMTRTMALEGEPLGIKVNALAPDATHEGYSEVTGNPNPAWAEATSQAWRAVATNGMIAVVAAVLAHEDCPANGELIACGGGRATQLFMGDPPGFYDPTLSPESLLDNWAQVQRQEGYITPRECIADGVKWSKQIAGIPVGT